MSVRSGARSLPVRTIEGPDDHDIQTQIRCDGKLTGGIGLDHVGMRRVVSASGETAWRRILRDGGSEGGRDRASRVDVRLDVRRRPERATGEDRQDRAISASVVRHQDEVTGGIDAQVAGPPPSELTVFRNVSSPSPWLTEKALTAPTAGSAIEIADLIGDIEIPLARIERQPAGVGCGHAGGRRIRRREDFDRA